MHPAPLEILLVPKHCVNSGRGGGGGLGGWEMMVSIELGVQSTPVVDAN